MEAAIRIEKRNGKQVLTTSTRSQLNSNIREESSSSSLSSPSSQGSTNTSQSRSQKANRKREELLMCGHTQEEDEKKKKKKRARREAQDGQSLCPSEASNTRSHSNQETTSCCCSRSSSTTTINTTRNGNKIASLKIKRAPGVRLLWVSTKKGVGVKITHGVMYISKESTDGCKIACHCHRSHFSLAQFGEHGGGSPPQIAYPHMNIVVRMDFL